MTATSVLIRSTAHCAGVLQLPREVVDFLFHQEHIAFVGGLHREHLGLHREHVLVDAAEGHPGRLQFGAQLANHLVAFGNLHVAVFQ
jgi:hypothetical protein